MLSLPNFKHGWWGGGGRKLILLPYHKNKISFLLILVRGMLHVQDSFLLLQAEKIGALIDKEKSE